MISARTAKEKSSRKQEKIAIPRPSIQKDTTENGRRLVSCQFSSSLSQYYVIIEISWYMPQINRYTGILTVNRFQGSVQLLLDIMPDRNSVSSLYASI